jgi:hypothetical protein
MKGLLKDYPIKVFQCDSVSEVDRMAYNFDLTTGTTKDLNFDIHHIKRHYYVAYGLAKKEKVLFNKKVIIDDMREYHIYFKEVA